MSDEDIITLEDIDKKKEKQRRLRGIETTQEDFPLGFIDKELEEQQSKPTVHLKSGEEWACARRHTMSGILKLLYDNVRAFYQMEICSAQHLNSASFQKQIPRLLELGIVKKYYTVLDKQTAYYEIVDRHAVKRILDKYFWIQGNKLSKQFLTFDTPVTVTALKKNPSFAIYCHQHYLTVDEGLDCLRRNTRYVKVVQISVFYDSVEAFQRKRQWNQ